MKVVGIIFLVLGLAGLGGGVYGMQQEQAARDTISEKQTLLRETFPDLESAAKLDDIGDLVAIDRELKDNFMIPEGTRDAAWDILNAMGDEEDMKMAKMGGFAGGGGLLAVGLLLTVLGSRKKTSQFA
jgi:hypothetical protein